MFNNGKKISRHEKTVCMTITIIRTLVRSYFRYCFDCFALLETNFCEIFSNMTDFFSVFGRTM